MCAWRPSTSSSSVSRASTPGLVASSARYHLTSTPLMFEASARLRPRGLNAGSGLMNMPKASTPLASMARQKSLSPMLRESHASPEPGGSCGQWPGAASCADAIEGQHSSATSSGKLAVCPFMSPPCTVIAWAEHSALPFDPQTRFRRRTACKCDQDHSALAQRVAPGLLAGVQAESLRGPVHGLPGEGHLRVAGPDALHVRHAARLVD